MVVRGGAPLQQAAPGIDGFSSGRVNEIQRARILDAMAQACAKLGAANVTVSCVVQLSGVSRRTFYELFTGREDCLLAAIDDALERASRRVLAAYRSSGRWRERIRTSLIAFLHFMDEEPFMGRLIVVETLGGGPRALERRQQVLAQVAAAIDEGREEAQAGNPPPLTAEGTVGGVLAVIHSRLHTAKGGSLLPLAGSLMSIITLPYLGSGVARKELELPVSAPRERRSAGLVNPLRDMEMRLTYRTVRVLVSVGECPGSSNRELALASGVQDQGQISKLLTRLSRLGLVENVRGDHARGAPNAWTLTDKGAEIQRAIGGRGDTS